MPVFFLAIGALQRKQIGAYHLTVITWFALDKVRGVFTLAFAGVKTHLAKGLARPAGLLAIATLLGTALLAHVALLGITHFLLENRFVCLFVWKYLLLLPEKVFQFFATLLRRHNDSGFHFRKGSRYKFMYTINL